MTDESDLHLNDGVGDRVLPAVDFFYEIFRWPC